MWHNCNDHPAPAAVPVLLAQSRPSHRLHWRQQRASRCTFATLFCCCHSRRLLLCSAPATVQHQHQLNCCCDYGGWCPLPKLYSTHVLQVKLQHTHTHMQSTPTVPTVGAGQWQCRNANGVWTWTNALNTAKKFSFHLNLCTYSSLKSAKFGYFISASVCCGRLCIVSCFNWAANVVSMQANSPS